MTTPWPGLPGDIKAEEHAYGVMGELESRIEDSSVSRWGSDAHSSENERQQFRHSLDVLAQRLQADKTTLGAVGLVKGMLREIELKERAYYFLS